MREKYELIPGKTRVLITDLQGECRGLGTYIGTVPLEGFEHLDASVAPDTLQFRLDDGGLTFTELECSTWSIVKEKTERYLAEEEAKLATKH